MFRIFSRPKGAPINDPRQGQPLWSKPGTPIDKSIKKRVGYLIGTAYSGKLSSAARRAAF